MKARAQPFPSDCQAYRPWPVLVYQCSSFWSLKQWRLLKNNKISLLHTHYKEAWKIPSSSHSLSPVTTYLFSYTWKSYTLYICNLKWPLITQHWCHHSHFAGFPKGVSQFPIYLFSMTTPLLYSHKAMWDKEEILSIHSPLRMEMEVSVDIQITCLTLSHHPEKSPPCDFYSLVQSILKGRDFALILMIIELYLF